MKTNRQAGFTLIELLVSLAVTAVLILGVLATFDLSSRVNRVQMSVADLQQSMRIAQNEVVKLTRMAGRGGGLPASQAVLLTNNVSSGTKLVSGAAASEILEGTDVVRVRGVVSGSVYQVEYLDGNVFTKPDGVGNGGKVVVLEKAAGVPQNLADLKKAAKNGETLLMITPFDTYFVATVRGTDDKVDFKGTFDGLEITFDANTVNAGMGGRPAAEQTGVAYLGVLEEYAFYVRKAGDGSSPKLARARLIPGTSTAYEDKPDEYAALDIADNIMDLQAVSTFVTPGLGLPDLRITTLARSDRRDPGQYLGPLLPATLEDHAYSTAHAYNSDSQRRYRWRVVRSNVDMRNL